MLFRSIAEALAGVKPNVAPAGSQAIRADYRNYLAGVRQMDPSAPGFTLGGPDSEHETSSDGSDEPLN